LSDRLSLAATELNALENDSYMASLEDFIDGHARTTIPMDQQAGSQRLQSARTLGPDFLAAACGWDILSVGPEDMIGGMKGVKLSRRLWQRLFARAPRRLRNLLRRVQERIRGRRGRRRRRKDCRTRSNPAFMPTGVPVHYDPEFTLDGLIPVSITSSWYGNLLDSGPLGRGRVAEVDATITRNDQGGFTYLDEDGFPINFPAPTPIPDGWVDGDTIRGARLLQGPRRSLLFRENGFTQTLAKGDDGIWRNNRRKVAMAMR
jgi:hypothetical protein